MTTDHLPASSASKRLPFPAYGPIEGLLGFAMFYIFVERATPTVVEVVTTALTDLSASAVQTGLAAALWVIFALTILDQLRRQYSAIWGSDASKQLRAPSELWLFGYFVTAVGFGLLAALTFERAVEMGISLIRIVGTLDVNLFDPLGFLVMLVFFIAYGLTTKAIDRIVIGTIRRLFPA